MMEGRLFSSIEAIKLRSSDRNIDQSRRGDVIPGTTPETFGLQGIPYGTTSRPSGP
jgi:hypothetical protein